MVAFEMPRMVPSFCNCVFSCHCLVLAGRGCRRRTSWRLLVSAYASLCLVSFQVCSRAFCGHFICAVPPVYVGIQFRLVCPIPLPGVTQIGFRLVRYSPSAWFVGVQVLWSAVRYECHTVCSPSTRPTGTAACPSNS